MLTTAIISLDMAMGQSGPLLGGEREEVPGDVGW